MWICPSSSQKFRGWLQKSRSPLDVKLEFCLRNMLTGQHPGNRQKQKKKRHTQNKTSVRTLLYGRCHDQTEQLWVFLVARISVVRFWSRLCESLVFCGYLPLGSAIIWSSNKNEGTCEGIQAGMEWNRNGDQPQQRRLMRMVLGMEVMMVGDNGCGLNTCKHGINQRNQHQLMGVWHSTCSIFLCTNALLLGKETRWWTGVRMNAAKPNVPLKN